MRHDIDLYHEEITENGSKMHGLGLRLVVSVLRMAVNEQEKEHKYIHGITAWPEPMCLVGQDYQVHDIAQFCRNTLQYHLIGIDTKFKLGEFYVAPKA